MELIQDMKVDNKFIEFWIKKLSQDDIKLLKYIFYSCCLFNREILIRITWKKLEECYYGCNNTCVSWSTFENVLGTDFYGVWCAIYKYLITDINSWCYLDRKKIFQKIFTDIVFCPRTWPMRTFKEQILYIIDEIIKTKDKKYIHLMCNNLKRIRKNPAYRLLEQFIDDELQLQFHHIVLKLLPHCSLDNKLNV